MALKIKYDPTSREALMQWVLRGCNPRSPNSRIQKMALLKILRTPPTPKYQRLAAEHERMSREVASLRRERPNVDALLKERDYLQKELAVAVEHARQFAPVVEMLTEAMRRAITPAAEGCATLRHETALVSDGAPARAAGPTGGCG